MRAGFETLMGETRLLELETFEELIQRLRAGDEEAATEFVRACEPHIHRAVRYPMRYFGLNRYLESTDISQAVLAAFFQRRLIFRVPLQHPAQLVRLLVRMARNKVVDHARKERAERRSHRRVPLDSGARGEVVAAVPGPDQAAASRDLFAEVYRRLSTEERRLVDLRNAGRDWASIAGERGASAVALRKQFSRALNRVARQLGIDDEPDE